MPVAEFVQEGHTVDHVLTADAAAGAVIDKGTYVGIMSASGKAGETVALAVTGIFAVNKFAGEAIADGATIYWDEGTQTATGTVAYSEAVMGRAIGAAAAGAARVKVLISPWAAGL